MGDWLHTKRLCPISKHTEEDKNQVSPAREGSYKYERKTRINPLLLD